MEKVDPEGLLQVEVPVGRRREFLAGEGDGVGGTAQAKAWGRKTGVHPVGNSYCAFRFAFSPHSSSRGWNHCCGFTGQEMCLREGQALAPGGTAGEWQGRGQRAFSCFLRVQGSRLLGGGGGGSREAKGREMP